MTSAFTTFELRRNPQTKILVVSASKVRAADFSTFVLRLIHEMPLLVHLKPRDDQRFSKEAFDVGPALADHSPSVKSVGITGQLAGSRADLIIADDIEVPNNSATPGMREKLANAVKEFDAIIKPNGRIIFLGTPQTEESLYNVVSERGYTVRIWPARYPSIEHLERRYDGKIAPLIANQVKQNKKLVGRTTEPLRFSDVDLMEREASYGRSGFALQFMLDTSLSDRDKFPLKLSDMLVMDLDKKIAPSNLTWASGPDQVVKDVPMVGFTGDRIHRPMWVSDEWIPYQGSVLAIDPSGRGKDETGWAVIKTLHGKLFLLDAGGFREGYTEAVLEGLANIAKQYSVNLILSEPNFGDGMFNQLLKPIVDRIYPVAVEEAPRSTMQKERRIIDTLEPVLNQHRLIVDKKLFEKDFKSTEDLPSEAINRYRLFYQLTRISQERGSLVNDDRLDAVALGVKYWTDVMANDVERVERDRKEALMKKELDRFMRNAVGNQGSKRLNFMKNFKLDK